jgi:hypothetical protein
VGGSPNLNVLLILMMAAILVVRLRSRRPPVRH